MILWRKKTNPESNEQEKRDDRLMHPQSAPALEPVIDDEIDIDPRMAHALNLTESEILEDISSLSFDQTNTGSPTTFYDRPLFPSISPVSNIQDTDDTDGTENNGGWLSRLATGLTKSSLKIGHGISDLITHKKLDTAALERLEEVLLFADLGPATTTKIIKKIADKTLDRDITDRELRQLLAREIEAILTPVAHPLIIKRQTSGPFVILMCGVNGVGKTTTIGKMAKIMHDQKHHSVMMVAGDTFRAAAVEQLQIWGARAHTPVMTRDIGADAAALAYESYAQAKQSSTEVMLIDTAGRLHNKTNLMAELEKIIRVLKKHDASLPHEVILVLDGTTGQNAFAQVETFKEMVNVTGLIITKLDGSAKGGVVVGLADQFGLPIYAVGVGETADDLQPFHAKGYAQALVGL